MDFGNVIHEMKKGSTKRYTREGWNGKGQWVTLQRPDEGSLMTRPYIYIHTNYDANVPWFPSQTDLLADDWKEE